VVLLAGDTFESNQLSPAVLDGAARLLAEAGMPIVILTGNHDAGDTTRHSCQISSNA
jgi:DNA repair exonuclease SbcCD nuclease subunit